MQVELKYSRQTPTFVIGFDDEGTERWFRKSVEFAIDGETLRVAVDENSWKRRLAAVRDTDDDDVQLIARKCMCCRRGFMAEAQMRICDNCKKSETWRFAGTTFSCVA